MNEAPEASLDKQLEFVISKLLKRSSTVYSAGELCELMELYQAWQKLKHFGYEADWYAVLQRCLAFRQRLLGEIHVKLITESKEPQ